MLQKLKSGFKGTINWNKHRSNLKTYAQNKHLNHLVNPIFQGISKLFVLSFENEDSRTSRSKYYLPKVKIKGYNFKIDGKKAFHQPINKSARTYENIRKLANGQGYDYTTGCLLDHPYFKENCKMIAIDLSKQQAHDGDRRASEWINYTENLDREGNTTSYLVIASHLSTNIKLSNNLLFINIKLLNTIV